VAVARTRRWLALRDRLPPARGLDEVLQFRRAHELAERRPGARRQRLPEQFRHAPVHVDHVPGGIDQRHAVAHVRQDVLAFVTLAFERLEPRAGVDRHLVE
jgi:hypothetical protein